MPVSRKIEKINSILAQETAMLLETEVDLPPETIVTVIGVDTSADLHYANILISIMPSSKNGSVLTLIKKKTFKIQKAINRRLRMRPVPKLRFCIMNQDSSHLDKLFEEIKITESPESKNT